MHIPMKKTAVAIATIALAVAAGQASAQGKKGPRASVASSTACSYEDGMLTITTTVTNKSSGERIAEVREGSIQPTYKPKDSRGNVFSDLGDAFPFAVPVEVDMDPVTFTAEVDLCDADIFALVEQARALNAAATVRYGLEDGEGETRTVTNQCSADPDTGEGGAIKVADVIDDILATCGF
jgi:hypothetical protein